MRTILNIDISMLDGSPAPMAERQAPAGLFQMGARADAPSEWSRWSGALGVAALVHAALLIGLVTLRPSAPAKAELDAPELVLYAFAPPPPPAAAAGPKSPVLASPRPVQARAQRPVL